MSKNEESEDYDQDFEDDFESESESAYSSASSKTPEESPRSTSKNSKSSSAASTPSKEKSQSKLSSSSPHKKSASGLSPKASTAASSGATSRSSSKATSSQHRTESAGTARDMYPTESAPDTAPEPESHASSVTAPTPRAEPTKPAPAGKAGASQKKKAGASTKGASTKQRSTRRAPVRVEPAKVPANQEQLDRMVEENQQLKDDIYNQHVQMFNASKAGTNHQGTMTAGATATSTVRGAEVSKKDAAARSVQEALLQERMAQMLRAEQKDLRRKRKELEVTIQKYRKASKYRHYVEKAKRDIAVLTDENRDLQLEVRCNEKLLVMNASVMDSGDGSHRLNEELRAQNALTQRSLEHAIRDTSDAERQRDAIKERVEALREKLDARQDKNSTGENPYAKLQELREENNNKKMTVARLKQMLQENQSYGGAQVGQASGAEYSYLEERIAHMKAELAKLKSQPFSSDAQAKQPTPAADGAAAPPPATGAASWLNEDDATTKPGPSNDGGSPPQASTNDNSDVFGTQPKKEANFLDSPFHPTQKPGAAAAPPAAAKKDEVPDWLGGDDDDAVENHDEEEEIGEDDEVEEEDEFAHELSVHDDEGKAKGGEKEKDNGGEEPDWLNF